MDEDKIITKLAEHDEQFTRVIVKLIEHDERFERIEENMFTKEEGRKMMDTLDGIAKICKDIREDHLFAIEWIKRLQWFEVCLSRTE